MDAYKAYRSLEVIKAVQYQGEVIPDVTCEGSEKQRLFNGCDNTRAHLPHVHTQAVGGLTVLKTGDWIFPLNGGPFGVAPDMKFRSHWEVRPEPVEFEPEPAALPPAPVIAAEPKKA